MRNRFPFISLSASLVLLRYSVALVFFLHAIVRIFNGTIPRFAAYLSGKGLPFGYALVIGITIFEIGGSIVMALNYFTRQLAAGFFIMLMIGNILIHFERGWFVGEHGDGGTEYSFVLMMALMVIAAGTTPKRVRS